MTVAIIHYHLRRGGVTRVIEAQSRALADRGIRHLVLSGSPYRGSADLPVHVLPELDYRSEPTAATAATLLEQLQSAATTTLGASPDAWHVHNPTLGKNSLFPQLIRELAESGERLALHFHDFAEDGRPANYRQLAGVDELYPIAPQIRYTTINSRDREVLVRAGVPERHTVFCPNAVVPPSQPAHPFPPSDSPLVLYPVRGIRRKNLGETCLLSAIAPPEARFAVTLPPENKAWLARYTEWVAFSDSRRLPLRFGVVGREAPLPGAGSSFEDWLSASTHCLTTSVAEGFGLAFLEPLALGKPLLGRDLPDITSDFTREAIDLGSLYHSLRLPRSWISERELGTCLEQGLRALYQRYGREATPSEVDQARDALFGRDTLDFANLPEPIQRSVIVRGQQDPEPLTVQIGSDSQPAAAWLLDTLRKRQPASGPNSLEAFSLTRYADRLEALYADLLTSDPSPVSWLPPERILAQFLKPERFHFLRT